MRDPGDRLLRCVCTCVAIKLASPRCTDAGGVRGLNRTRRGASDLPFGTFCPLRQNKTGEEQGGLTTHSITALHTLQVHPNVTVVSEGSPKKNTGGCVCVKIL